MPRVDHVDALRFAQTCQLRCAASILQPRLQLGQRTELQAPRRVALFGVQGIERGEGGLEITGRVQGPHPHPQRVTPLARERAGRGQRDGGIGVRTFAGERRIGAEFGYWLGSRHWGRGIMTRVVAAFAPWVMDALELQRLQATVLDFNHASARVLEKNGFVEEGVLRRAVCKRGGVHDLRMFARLRAA